VVSSPSVVWRVSSSALDGGRTTFLGSPAHPLAARATRSHRSRRIPPPPSLLFVTERRAATRRSRRHAAVSGRVEPGHIPLRQITLSAPGCLTPRPPRTQ